jgi:hypothetical protein
MKTFFNYIGTVKNIFAKLVFLKLSLVMLKVLI